MVSLLIRVNDHPSPFALNLTLCEHEGETEAAFASARNTAGDQGFSLRNLARIVTFLNKPSELHERKTNRRHNSTA
jgi:hypothetical protein